MDKRLEKRHKRQVARARAKTKTSEIDLRTPEQIAEARAASKANVPRMGAVAQPTWRKTQRTSRSSNLSSSSKADG
jgi:hypothetical protein